MPEEHIELYKKYRPKRWKDILGQDQVIMSITEALKNETVPSAYLFAGESGSGKTSTALLLAKALNCKYRDPVTQDPCLECPTCKAIEQGVQAGVNYVPMANKGGVDDVRQMLEDALVAQPVEKKVWICDEVQNLSVQAFDSLLVPLENENKNTLFIFCTTEPEKIRATVRSRLHIRKFSPLSLRDLLSLMLKVMGEEGYSKDFIVSHKEDLMEIAKIADGRARDALVLLETFLNTGFLPGRHEDKIMDALLKKDIIALFQVIDDLEKENVDFIGETENLYKHLVNILCGRENHEKDQEFVKVYQDAGIMKILDMIAASLKNMSLKFVDSKILFTILLSEIVRL